VSTIQGDAGFLPSTVSFAVLHPPLDEPRPIDPFLMLKALEQVDPGPQKHPKAFPRAKCVAKCIKCVVLEHVPQHNDTLNDEA
jgi:hypothetical protein